MTILGFFLKCCVSLCCFPFYGFFWCWMASLGAMWW